MRQPFKIKKGGVVSVAQVNTQSLYESKKRNRSKKSISTHYPSPFFYHPPDLQQALILDKQQNL
jgi:hypothetical protein